MNFRSTLLFLGSIGLNGCETQTSTKEPVQRTPVTQSCPELEPYMQRARECLLDDMKSSDKKADTNKFSEISSSQFALSEISSSQFALKDCALSNGRLRFTLVENETGTVRANFNDDIRLAVEAIKTSLFPHTDTICRAKANDQDIDGYDNTVDCNDTNPTVHPGETERCDGIDNDCDETVDLNSIETKDEGSYQLYYEDKDGDERGNGNAKKCIHEIRIGPWGVPGWTKNAGDKNDNDAYTR